MQITKDHKFEIYQFRNKCRPKQNEWQQLSV